MEQDLSDFKALSSMPGRGIDVENDLALFVADLMSLKAFLTPFSPPWSEIQNFRGNGHFLGSCIFLVAT
jgi:hypothetical protein